MAIIKRSLTLIIAVYNAVEYLELILLALQRQTFQNFEVVIADDGSGPEIRQLIERMQPEFAFPIQHLWQEDRGFRKNAMLNQAIKSSQTDYLVFIDGDCVPHREFLQDHHSQRRSMSVLCGRRVNFSKEITEQTTVDDILSGKYERLSLRLLFDGLMARSANIEDSIRIPNPFVRGMLHRNRARILGCNFSVEKSALERINGFNEDYQAPGLGEDSDIAFRLDLIGVKLLTLRYLAVLFHLYHPVTLVSNENKKLFEQIVTSKQPICMNGLRKITA